MKRRDFSIQLAGAGLGLAMAGGARAQGGPVEGTHYVRLQTPAPTSIPEGKKVEVVEFFWYECGHCFNFEPLLETWSKRLPADVVFRRVPVGFTARHQIAQKIFYALEEMGQVGAVHRKVFNAIHVQGKRLLSESDIIDFMVANGLDGKRFGDAFRSFSVATKASRAKQLADAYKIDGVPAMGIQGRYYTSGALAGGHERALAVADFLIARSRQGA
ncbi:MULTISPECIES: thiol:disulfide interchange protein DsbA/DsbL [Rubrivivax]|uniref:Thiol:disulfide interchange protein n=1 Tax=Rubrivivax benzoatilyticus TaxID=316997 RepID=A0ABX0HUB9_9BURK|nr:MULTISPECIES: thiol:disulfide interchange protein DsbA/DsbL [Rubrivivax]MCD0423022.1 thiol:disulfide interchange protein DsbA/DsbL [Rubrivivax sp. JA1024]EGJ11295.1 thiol:disulfide interchange protein [Rubrivivax benzoatilyticus JA2 = ATCC BAA-35]MCC9596635.1 thiol:disulfide interchange protein DsbA/DsbL [Rubrivivax sp. JA1055]MCC9648792.1 thiol:disulfide interchange protein DsbA/DsbL [Rubrivivax sp. JA1029]NHK98630.1 thiol:disulfide interchange protein DsbA/DsbL [Rubrivivax benzoatilyticus